MSPDGPRELDEQFADWVDGRLSGEALARFEDELDRDPELRELADAYRNDVGFLREAMVEDSRRRDVAPVNFVAAVMSEVGTARTGRRWLPVLLSSAAAAALLGIYALLGQFQAEQTPPASTMIAKGDAASSEAAGAAAKDENDSVSFDAGLLLESAREGAATDRDSEELAKKESLARMESQPGTKAPGAQEPAGGAGSFGYVEPADGAPPPATRAPAETRSPTSETVVPTAGVASGGATPPASGAEPGRDAGGEAEDLSDPTAVTERLGAARDRVKALEQKLRAVPPGAAEEARQQLGQVGEDANLDYLRAYLGRYRPAGPDGQSLAQPNSLAFGRPVLVVTVPVAETATGRTIATRQHATGRRTFAGGADDSETKDKARKVTEGAPAAVPELALGFRAFAPTPGPEWRDNMMRPSVVPITLQPQVTQMDNFFLGAGVQPVVGEQWFWVSGQSAQIEEFVRKLRIEVAERGGSLLADQATPQLEAGVRWLEAKELPSNERPSNERRGGGLADDRSVAAYQQPPGAVSIYVVLRPGEATQPADVPAEIREAEKAADEKAATERSATQKPAPKAGAGKKL